MTLEVAGGHEDWKSTPNGQTPPDIDMCFFPHSFYASSD